MIYIYDSCCFASHFFNGIRLICARENVCAAMPLPLPEILLFCVSFFQFPRHAFACSVCAFFWKLHLCSSVFGKLQHMLHAALNEFIFIWNLVVVDIAHWTEFTISWTESHFFAASSPSSYVQRVSCTAHAQHIHHTFVFNFFFQILSFL